MGLPARLQHVKDIGFAVFEAGEYNLNIIGVRTRSRIAGKFDDWLECYYKVGGVWHSHQWPATTDPGVYWLQHPMRPDGTAILAPGQYRGAYQVGLHKGYAALVQVGTLRVYRDRNKDGTLDAVNLKTATGTGINIHAAALNPFGSVDRVRTEVGKWSAGCQVFADAEDYREWWAIVERAVKRWGPRFTYTLVLE